MSWIAVASIGGAAVGGLSSNMASKTQSEAGRRAVELQGRIYDTSRSDLSPYRDAGLAAVTGAHYEGGHWLGSFAVYLTTRRGIH